jgi:hypothetical protein
VRTAVHMHIRVLNPWRLKREKLTTAETVLKPRGQHSRHRLQSKLIRAVLFGFLLLAGLAWKEGTLTSTSVITMSSQIYRCAQLQTTSPAERLSQHSVFRLRATTVVPYCTKLEHFGDAETVMTIR